MRQANKIVKTILRRPRQRFSGGPNKIADYKNRITALHRINGFLEHIEDLDSLLGLIMQEASQTVNAQASSIALYEPQKKELIFTIALGKKGDRIKQMRMKLGQGIIGYVAQTRKSLNIKDVTKDKRFYSGADEKSKFKSKSILAVPIIHNQKLVGALEVINKKSAPSFSPNDIELLEIVAGQAAIAIENAKLYQRLEKKHEALIQKHKQIITMQQKLVSMERLSAIGDMASRIVHDLRNPLSIIKGYAEMSRMSGVTEEEKEGFNKLIHDEVGRITGMITEILEFASGKVNTLFANHSFREFINEVQGFLERDFKAKNIKLTVESNYSGSIYMDKYKMQRLIFNLSSNSKDVMPNGGAFKITANVIDENKNIEIRLSDTGGGIPKEVKDKLFQPFATFGKAHGTGLGLPIVKKIAELHGGTITVECPPPIEGAFNTTFVLKLPLCKQEQPPQEQSTKV